MEAGEGFCACQCESVGLPVARLAAFVFICRPLLALLAAGTAPLCSSSPTPSLSSCLDVSLFFFFSSLALPCAFFHLSAALPSSCNLPAVASLYKCLPPFVAVCLVCHCDIWQIARRTALSLRLPFWLMMFTPVIISYRAACQERHRHTGVSCHLILRPELFFVPFFFSFWRPLWHLANGLLSMSLFPSIILSQLGKLKSTALLYHPGLDLFPSSERTNDIRKVWHFCQKCCKTSTDVLILGWIHEWSNYGRWAQWRHRRQQFSSVQWPWIRNNWGYSGYFGCKHAVNITLTR